MNIIDDETKKEVLSHFPEKYHELLKKQMLIINETINNNMNSYLHSQDFRRGIDMVLKDILYGKYLGINPFEEDDRNVLEK